MAMAKPVVVSSAAADGVTARPASTSRTADDAKEILSQSAGGDASGSEPAMGQRARARIVADYCWSRKFSAFTNCSMRTRAPLQVLRGGRRCTLTRSSDGLLHARLHRRAHGVTLLFALIVVSILGIVWPITRSMVDTWQHSSTYGHCYVVIPVAVWMAWRESAPPASVPLKPFWPGFALIAAIGFVGLLGELASVAVVTQFAAVGVAVATALTVARMELGESLAFPLGFLFLRCRAAGIVPGEGSGRRT